MSLWVTVDQKCFKRTGGYEKPQHAGRAQHEQNRPQGGAVGDVGEGVKHAQADEYPGQPIDGRMRGAGDAGDDHRGGKSREGFEMVALRPIRPPPCASQCFGIKARRVIVGAALLRIGGGGVGQEGGCEDHPVGEIHPMFSRALLF
jgi:hypothetical protein